MASWQQEHQSHHSREAKQQQNFAARLAHLEDRFNNGVYAADFKAGGLGTNVRVRHDCTGFVVEVNPWPDLWMSSMVVFEVVLPEGFPKARPQARWTRCEESLRKDPRLRSPESGDLRLTDDKRVLSNLFESRYMGWLETYDLEVVVHTLRRLFRKPDEDLAPCATWYKRKTPFAVAVEGAFYEEQGARKEMEDRVCADDGRFVGPSAALTHRFGVAAADTTDNTAVDAAADVDAATATSKHASFSFSEGKAAAAVHAAGSYNGGGDDDGGDDGKTKSISNNNNTDAVPRLNGILSDGSQAIPLAHQTLLEDSSDDGSELSAPMPEYLASLGLHRSIVDSILTGSKAVAAASTGISSASASGTANASAAAHQLLHHEHATKTLRGRKVSLHAVFDGHGGDEAAEAASHLLPDFFFADLEDPAMSIERALYNAVLRVETALAARAEEERESTGHVDTTAGTTVCAVAIDLNQGVAHCANVGDSRAVLCRNDGVAMDLSRDHKADLPAEIARIVDMGGFVSYGRVMGMLAVSRALGDPEMKVPYPLVSSLPDLCTVDLNPADEFILIACDGVFDVMTSQEAVHFVRGVIPMAPHDLENAAFSLVRNCIVSLGSPDNVSVILIRLHDTKSPHRVRAGSARAQPTSIAHVLHGETDSYTTGDSGMDHLHHAFADVDVESETSSDTASEPRSVPDDVFHPILAETGSVDGAGVAQQPPPPPPPPPSSRSSQSAEVDASSGRASSTGGFLSPQVQAALRASRLRKSGSGERISPGDAR